LVPAPVKNNNLRKKFQGHNINLVLIDKKPLQGGWMAKVIEVNLAGQLSSRTGGGTGAYVPAAAGERIEIRGFAAFPCTSGTAPDAIPRLAIPSS
jgi:hypothetical protein